MLFTASLTMHLTRNDLPSPLRENVLVVLLEVNQEPQGTAFGVIITPEPED